MNTMQGSLVGEVTIPDAAPEWLSNLCKTLVQVEQTQAVAQLSALVDRIRTQSRERAIAQARALASEFELQVSDVFGATPSAKNAKRASLPPKYRDPSTGKTWTGRGMAPKWMNGKNKDDFLIA